MTAPWQPLPARTDWLKGIRSGTTTYYWAVAAAMGCSTIRWWIRLAGFGLVRGGSWRFLYFAGWSVLLVVGSVLSIPAMLGVLGITRRIPSAGGLGADHGLRSIARWMAVLTACGELAYAAITVAMYVGNPRGPDAMALMIAYWARNISDAVATISLFLFVRMLASRFEGHGAARRADIVARAYGGLFLLDVAYRAVDSYSESTALSQPDIRMAASSVLFLLGLVIVIYSLRVIKFWARNLGNAAADRCLACGYIITGLTDGVCPECGTVIDMPPLAMPVGTGALASQPERS